MTHPDKLSDFRSFVLGHPPALERLKGIDDRAELARQAARVAAEHGFALSEADIAAALHSAQRGELSDSQLASVAGGANGEVVTTYQVTACHFVYGRCT